LSLFNLDRQSVPGLYATKVRCSSREAARTRLAVPSGDTGLIIRLINTCPSRSGLVKDYVLSRAPALFA
jgi:hypothetical protein